MTTDAENRDLAKLEKILVFAQKKRELDKSPRWKTDLNAVMDEHSETCDAVWGLLDELLDIRVARGQPVAALKPPQDMKKQMKKLVQAALKQHLPDAIQSAIEDAVEALEL